MRLEEMLREIDRFAEELNEHGWDSYDAEPISHRTAELAKSVARQLFSDTEEWEVSPSAEGEIWFTTDDERMIISAWVYDEEDN